MDAALQKRIDRQVEWVQKWPHFLQAKRILEVGSGTFDTLNFLAKKYPDKEFYGIDFVLGEDALLPLKQAPTNLTAIKHDIVNLDFFSAEQFDFAYSVAVLEHIRPLAIHLASMYRVLVEGGRYCYIEQPFWSSSLGHHFKHNSADCPVPPYGHLYMTEAELRHYLETQTSLEERTVRGVIRQVYQRQDLSRLSRTETHRIVEASPFVIESWEEKKDANFSDELANRVMANNVYQLEVGDLRISGVVASLLKPKPIPLTRWQKFWKRLRP
jgi:ubiquinone/menaquinone biosynthesis C-methylase UbiE